VADPVPVDVSIFTDPYDAWSWAMEPARRRLQAEFGDGVRVTFVLAPMFREITGAPVLALTALDAQERSGMPVDARVWLADPPRSTQPACLALAAAREQDHAGFVAYLRRLREAVLLERRRMDSAPALLDAARESGGLDLARLEAAFGSSGVVEDLGRDMERAGGRPLPSLEARGADGTVHRVDGFVGYERWREALLAAGAAPAPPAAPPTVAEALAAHGPLAVPEVAALCDLPGPRAPAELWRLAAEWRARPVGQLWAAA
jgi:putative protein-disulfide isomerase